MKLQKSKQEEAFNNFWNNNIVVLDKEIRFQIQKSPFFFPPIEEVNKLIEAYLIALNSLINDIQAIYLHYTDKKYMQEYLSECLAEGSEDFSSYQLSMNQRKWDKTGFHSLLEKAHPLFKEALVNKGVLTLSVASESTMQI